ncbi:hypothetical protein BKA67DRAFT_173469 [Truncatella angustata]|uniref:Dienelactone hydrolase domain-containing protein n=1 Tax=Truncatella angustata TaxID=152316 RepID=A0A9P8UR90_9PEZI|nr:uncharacterized protein BKA67DRAFT_173469 [Truncatella angustata]KAH6656894.1 hypothetical protein BKA67DRAFT_173469 [Truncatella angustata]
MMHSNLRSEPPKNIPRIPMAATNEYMAQPPGVCCLKGNLHEGQPLGKFLRIGNVDTYVSKPPEDKSNGHIILYFPDVWGMFTNGLLVMDGFAAAGFLVLGPDYFRGDPVTKHKKDRHDKTTEPGFDYEAWKAMHTSFADVAVPAWVEAVREQYGKLETKYACVGYCFGAPYVCDQLSGSGVCSVGAFAHPAFLKEHHLISLSSWVKEQSLSGIIEWFEFWLTQG